VCTADLKRTFTGFNFVILGATGTGKSSFIKTMFNSFDIACDIAISDHTSCTKGVDVYPNKKYNVYFIDTEGTEEDKITATEILNLVCKKIGTLAPKPTLYFVTTDVDHCREREATEFLKPTIDMLEALNNKNLLPQTLLLYTKIDKLDCSRTIKIDEFNEGIKKGDEQTCSRIIGEHNRVAHEKIEMYDMMLLEQLKNKLIDFDVREKRILWSNRNVYNNQFTQLNGKNKVRHCPFPFLKTEDVTIPDKYWDQCRNPDVFITFLEKILSIQQNEKFLINFINTTINNMPICIKLYTIMYNKLLYLLGRLELPNTKK